MQPDSWKLSLLVPWMSTLNPSWLAAPFLPGIFAWVTRVPSTGGYLTTNSEAAEVCGFCSILFIFILTRNQWFIVVWAWVGLIWSTDRI